jgi:hypothetical protein
VQHLCFLGDDGENALHELNPICVHAPSPASADDSDALWGVEVEYKLQQMIVLVMALRSFALRPHARPCDIAS